MKTFFKILVFLSIVYNSNAQNIDVVSFPQQIDSMYYLTYNKSNNTWVLEDIRHYNYTNEKLISLQLVDGISYDSIWKWEYYYNQFDEVNYQVYYKWDNNQALLKQKIETNFNNNLPSTSLISNMNNNIWTVIKKTIFVYHNDTLKREILQNKNKNGILYDYQYTDYEYYNGKISLINIIRVADGKKIKCQKYTYDKNDKVKSVTYYDVNTTNNTLIPVSKRIFSYDMYMLNNEVLFYLWNNNDWDLSYKYKYFRKIEFLTNKIAICFNGHTIYVAKEAVPNFILKGAKIGKCKDTKENISNNSNSIAINNLQLNIFPNPASEELNISLGNQFENYDKIEILDIYGNIVYRYNVDNADLKIDISMVKSGLYFVKFSGKQEFIKKIIIQ